MLSHISVLPLQHEWMQESRSVGSMIRLAADYEGSDRKSRTFWLWKASVLAGEGKRAGSVGASALAEEDKCLVEEDKCACCGKRVR